MTMAKLLLLLLLSPLVIGSECDKDWCEENCAELNTCDGDEACDMTYSICEEKGCPCPLYNERELNISVSCTSSQMVWVPLVLWIKATLGVLIMWRFHVVSLPWVRR